MHFYQRLVEREQADVIFARLQPGQQLARRFFGRGSLFSHIHAATDVGEQGNSHRRLGPAELQNLGRLPVVEQVKVIDGQ